MTLDQPTSAPHDVPVENLFEITMRGYHKRQVEDYVAWLQDQASGVKAELAEARRELAVTREDVGVMRQQLATRPQHEEISARLTQILRLAEEEAQQERDQAAAQAAVALEEARQQGQGVLAAARNDAEAIVASAQRQADEELSSARAEASHLVETATSQSRAMLEDARMRAERMLGDADRRTAAITALQEERLASLLTVHSDAVRRLEQIRGVLGEVLQEEHDQGAAGARIDPAPLPGAGTPLSAADAARPSSGRFTMPGAPGPQAAMRPVPAQGEAQVLFAGASPSVEVREPVRSVAADPHAVREHPEEPGTPGVDAGPGTGVGPVALGDDLRHDPGSEAGPHVGPDRGHEPGYDGGHEPGHDLGHDAGHELGPESRQDAEHRGDAAQGAPVPAHS